MNRPRFDGHRAPWLKIAAEARWRVLAHLKHEQRESVRQFLSAHLRRLEGVIRDKRDGRAA